MKQVRPIGAEQVDLDSSELENQNRPSKKWSTTKIDFADVIKDDRHQESFGYSDKEFYEWKSAYFALNICEIPLRLLEYSLN